jgi:hypothetical protein
MHFYLPAVMCHFLRSKRRSMIHDSLLCRLEPDTGDLKGYQRKNLRLLTFEQREAILGFLEAIGEGPLEPWRRVVELGENADWFRKFY